MASKGRGNRSSTLTKEQLQQLGCVGQDKSIPVLTVPPPTFPPLLNKPLPIKDIEEKSLQVLWQQRFLIRMKESPVYFNLNDSQHTNPITKLKFGSAEHKSKINFPQHLMPKELFDDDRKRNISQNSFIMPKIKKKNVEDITERLKLLEEKEKLEPETLKKEHKSDSEIEEEENIDRDDEMDDENDYGHSYFDNGESYNEEDDNMDDGPVY